MQVLSRRTKNNPVLIGEPGVGKTAVVEGLAQRIVEGRRARDAADKRSHARPRRAGRRRQVPRRVRGAAQGRAQGDPHPRARSSCSSTSCTRSSAPAPPRARWTPATCSSRCWPAASCRRRRDHARRVPQAHREGRRARAPLPAGPVGEPSSRTPSRSCAGCGAATRRTTGCDHRRALVAAATLSDRYITDRFLPDKAIDLVDEAGVAAAHGDRLRRSRSTS
jgi:hypothetical protein